MSETTPQPLKELKTAIDQYNLKRKSFSAEELQDCRDKINTSLFYLADFYSDIKAASDAADFGRKNSVSSEKIRLLAQIDPDTQKNYTASKAEQLARINTELKEKELVEAKRRYYKINMIVESAFQMLNTIAGRKASISKPI